MKVLTADVLKALGADTKTVLTALGYRVIPQEAIAAHKARELAKAPPPSRWLIIRPVTQWLMLNGDDMARTSLYSAMTGCVVTVLVWGVWRFLSPTEDMYVILLVSSLTTLYLWLMTAGWFGLFDLSWRLGEMKVRERAAWYPLAESSLIGDSHAPAEAARLIAEVRALRPGVSVVVHKLLQHERVLDPILEIDGHAVLVWDKDGKILSL